MNMIRNKKNSIITSKSEGVVTTLDYLDTFLPYNNNNMVCFASYNHHLKPFA